MGTTGAVASRALFVCVFLIVIVRVLGKREIGNFTAFDLIVALMLGEVHSESVLGWVSGTATPVLRAGQLLRPALRAERLADADVQASMRLEGVSDIREVDQDA